MNKLLLAAFLFASPALAATAPPPGEPKLNDPLASLLTLDKDLQASRVGKKQARLDDFREELQLSTNGHEVEMDKIPLAPEETGAPLPQ